MIDLSMADPEHNLRPRLTVMGVGGAGGNAINNMIRCQLEGCDFIAANTDSQALALSLASRKIQLGVNMSRGLGAGSKADMGRAAAEEQIGDIMAVLEGSDMLFVTAGMGGGTGTGAAPVIARAARDSGILTVGVVTKPFHFEGNNRMRQAEAGIAELQQYVDTLIVIPNQNLFRIANERTTFAEAFRLADEVLHCGVRGITDLMVMPGFMNLDFADVKTVMGEMGKAMMGTGEADGDNRAIRAAEAAISNPLLDDVSMKGARGVLINITGGMDMTLFEVDQAANRIREEVDPEAQIKVGSTLGDNLEGKIRVSVIATGIDVAASTRATTTVSTATGSGRMAPKQAAPQQQAYRAAIPPQNSQPQNMPQNVVTPSVSAQTNYFTMQQPQPAPVHAAPAPEAIAPQRQSAPIEEEAAYDDAPAQEVETVAVYAEELDIAPAPQAKAPAPQPRAAQPQSQHQPQHQSQHQPQARATAPASGMTTRSAQPSSSTPFDMRMTQLTSAAAPQQSSSQSGGGAEQRRQRRAESLFTRITGFGMVRPSSQHHEDDLDESQLPDERLADQQHLGVNPSDRPTLSAEQPEDLLEIPAFLRRQNNH
ncbi:MAG: cell division protein FtsZ [Alphaproteobacteria bacterium]|nr:cell division protein FtsZ [Alphaproteobacteria bacterium]